MYFLWYHPLFGGSPSPQRPPSSSFPSSCHTAAAEPKFRRFTRQNPWSLKGSPGQDKLVLEVETAGCPIKVWPILRENKAESLRVKTLIFCETLWVSTPSVQFGDNWFVPGFWSGSGAPVEPQLMFRSDLNRLHLTISGNFGTVITELDAGKIYRKPLYLMVKPMVSCRFSLKSIEVILTNHHF